MFTGLVAELGTVRGLKRVQNSYHLTVAARKVLDNLKIGDSVAVNGVCLTVVVLGSGEFTADVMPETMRLSNLRDLRSGDRVNLERTLRLMDGDVYKRQYGRFVEVPAWPGYRLRGAAGVENLSTSAGR